MADEFSTQYCLTSPYFANFLEEDERARNDFLRRYDGLSETLKDFLVNPQTADELLEIGARYGMEEFDVEPVSKIVRDIAMGDLFIRDMPLQVSVKTKLGIEKATSLSNEVVKSIPAETMEEIKKIQRKNFAATIARLEAQQKNAKPPVPPASAQTKTEQSPKTLIFSQRPESRGSISSLRQLPPAQTDRSTPAKKAPIPATSRPTPPNPWSKTFNIPKPNILKGNIIDLRTKVGARH